MKEKFALTIGESAIRRLNGRQVTKKQIDLCIIIDLLNFQESPYTQWTSVIEDTIIKAIQQKL